MELRDLFLTGSFQHSNPSETSYSEENFLFTSTNGTISPLEIYQEFENTIDSLNSNLAFLVRLIEGFTLKQVPRDPLKIFPNFTDRISLNDEGFTSFSQLPFFYGVTDSDGTKPAEEIYFQYGTLQFSRPIGFEDAGKRGRGLIYPRKKTGFRAIPKSLIPTQFGLFSPGGIRLSTRKKFFQGLIHPINLF